MAQPLNNSAMDQLFVKARTVNGWLDTPVSDDQLMALYDLMKMGPTSANCCPARLVFVKSADAKEKLLPYVAEGNRAKVEAAPVTVIIGTDYKFAEQLPKLFPHDLTAKTWFADPEVRDVTAFRNGTLQAGYLIMAARSLGLDCGPMSGFDQAGVDKIYFEGTEIKSNFICSLGYGSEEGLFDRSPRLIFDEAAKIL